MEPLESHFQAHELFETATEAQPIMITRKEIYSMLSILMRNKMVVVRTAPHFHARLIRQTNNNTNDPIAAVLDELEGPPIEYDKSNTPVSLRLTNRLVDLKRENLRVSSAVLADGGSP